MDSLRTLGSKSNQIILLKFQARDADKTSEVIYSIKLGNIQDLFTIDHHTGEVKVTNLAGLDMTNVPTDTIDLTVQVRI